MALVVKNPPANAADATDMSWLSGSGKSTGEEKATHSCILAWRITLTEEPDRLLSIGSYRVRHNWSDSVYIDILFSRWLSGKESTCQYKRHKRHGFDPWVGKITWRRKWKSVPVFLPGKSHRQRSPASYSSWGCKRVGHDLVTKQQLLSSIISIVMKMIQI